MSTGIPYFPTQLPARTVVGNLSTQAGEAEAIAIATLSSELADASTVTFIQSGTGAVTRTVQSKLRELLTSADNPTIGLHNTGVGETPLAAITSGAGNTAVGFDALKSVTTSDENTAFGYSALKSITSTSGADGRHNVAFGSHALEAVTSGAQNCGVGNQALQLNTTSDNNVAVGNASLHDLNGGTGGNVAVGIDSCRLLTSGVENVAVGTTALSSDLTGSGNTAVGHAALQNALGTSNVAVGYRAGRYETGSNSFYVDNQDRANTAGDKAKALLYGTFDSSAANQRLVVNAIETKSVQPAFLVTASAGTDVTGDATVATVAWGTEIYDQHGDFSANTFIAPVTGRYHFDVILNAAGLAVGNTLFLVTLVASNRSIRLIACNPSAMIFSGELALSAGTDVDMDANDTATITFRADGGAKVVDISTNSTWSGHLVC